MIQREKFKTLSIKGSTADLINKYCIFNGPKYFSSDGLQNYIVFVSKRHIYWISKNDSDSKTELWESTGMSQTTIKNLYTSDITFAPLLQS